MRMSEGASSLYPDPYIEDGKVWAYYNVTTTGSATSLLYSTNNIASMEVDGVSVTVAKTYTFSTEGEHLVKYSLTDNTIFGALNTGDRAAFRSVTTIKRCYLPETIKTLGNYQFASASNVEYVKFPSQLEVLGQNCFYSCSNLVITNLLLPSLTTLGSGCFQNCGKIVKISNLGVITTVSSSALRAMGALTDLILPSTLTSLADASIFSCGALKRVVCYATTPPSRYSNVFSQSSLEYIKVPANSVSAYKAASDWSSYASIIQAISE